jgi:hypothetical protein
MRDSPCKANRGGRAQGKGGVVRGEPQGGNREQHDEDRGQPAEPEVETLTEVAPSVRAGQIMQVRRREEAGRVGPAP